MPKEVFISHSAGDASIALAVCDFLETHGIGCWIAPRDVAPGSPFEEQILAAIAQCQAVVLVLSTRSNESPFVKNEVNRAFVQRKPIFTLRAEDVRPSGALELYLASHQWVDGFPPPLNERLPRFTAAILALIGRTSTKLPQFKTLTSRAPAASPTIVDSPISSQAPEASQPIVWTPTQRARYTMAKVSTFDDSSVTLEVYCYGVHLTKGSSKRTIPTTDILRIEFDQNRGPKGRDSHDDPQRASSPSAPIGATGWMENPVITLMNGQTVECVEGETASVYGGSSWLTAFDQNGWETTIWANTIKSIEYLR